MDEAGWGLRVMRILIDHGCEPGNDYADRLAQTWYDEAGLTDEETERGLAFDRDKEWIIMSRDRLGIFQVTQAGFDVATTGRS
jgi:hypothetical protein